MEKYPILLFDFVENNPHFTGENFSMLTYVKKVEVTGSSENNSQFAFSPEKKDLAKLLATEKVAEYFYRPEKQSQSKKVIRGGVEIKELFAQNIRIITAENKFIPGNPVLELRFKKDGQWTYWQGIPGKFLLLGNYQLQVSGIADLYGAITEKNLANLEDNFQMRFSGYYQGQLTEGHLPRIYGDPLENNMTKIIDPYTDQILFDSKAVETLSLEEKLASWAFFIKRYETN